MKVSGFTFVKDAELYDFPLVESIKSILPICDELIVNVGVSSDNTLEIVKSIESGGKIKIIETKWDDLFKVKMRILAQQTNIALYQCTGDWCLYLQADEVISEVDYDRILKSMTDNLNNEKVEGLLFDYFHFFGDFDHYIDSYHWYRKEIRIIRNHLGITSWRDAQGFRVDGKKLKVKDTCANVFHYGWVRDPYKMGVKKDYQKTLHSGGEFEKKEKRFFYEEHIFKYMLNEYDGLHPALMNDRIKNWSYPLDWSKFNKKPKLKDRRHQLTDFIDKNTGLKIGEYKNYILLNR